MKDFSMTSLYFSLASAALINAGIDRQVYYIFSHGLFNNHRQAFKYLKTYTHKKKIIVNDRFIIDGPCALFDYPDATRSLLRIKPGKSALGQDADIARLKEVYDAVCADAQKNGNDNFVIIFVGPSRGAATIINFVALHKPDHVGALILESPYDSMTTIIDHIRHNVGYVVSHDAMQKLFEIFFRKYTRFGIAPIDVIDRIDHTIPILILCSEQDQRVPATSSFALYEKLQQTGHPHTHIIVLNYGKHDNLYTGPEGKWYAAAVHAFYAQYGFPHDATIAQQGRYFFVSACLS